MSDIINGKNPILEALKAGRPINKILIEKNISRHSNIAEILNIAKQQDIPVEFVGRFIIDKESPPGINQGIIAFIASKDYVNLEDLYEISLQKNEPSFYIILDGIEDPQNLGAILRTAEAAGVHGVIIRSRREVGLTSGVARASAGAIEYVPVARVTNIAQTIEELKNKNIWVVGIDMSGETNYQKVDFKSSTALVIGGEGKGLSELVRKRCDVIASIPMKGKMSSLNASVAAALVMYEVFTQRTS
jgi:23S rRNA (guanosine2251-2'-O)-methyltransferase